MIHNRNIDAEHSVQFMEQSLLSVNSHTLNRDRRYVVKNLLLASQVSLLCGAPNTGKSAIISAIAAHIARGRDFAGLKSSQAAVLYVAAEDPNGIADRAHPYLCAGATAASPFNIFPDKINLCSDEELELFIDEAILYQRATNSQRLLIVIDTLNLCIGDGDENSARDMGRAMGNAQRIARATGAHVMIVHHTSGHDGSRPRGSTAMEGNVDTLLTLHRADGQQPEGTVFIAQRKQRSVPKGGPIAFRIEAFDGGLDSEGDPLTVPMAVPFEPKSSLMPQTKKKATHENQSDARKNDLRRVLVDLESAHPSKWFDTATIRDNSGAAFNNVRENTETLGRTVRKALDFLLKSGEVEKNKAGLSDVSTNGTV